MGDVGETGSTAVAGTHAGRTPDRSPPSLRGLPEVLFPPPRSVPQTTSFEHHTNNYADHVMRLPSRSVLALLSLGLVLLVVPEAAHAYGGPGSVISGIGALLAAVAALLASLFGFIWFPLKRLYQKMSEDDEEPAAATAEASEDASAGG